MWERPCSCLGLFCVLHIICVLVFLKGFLLTRVELPDLAPPLTQQQLQQQPWATYDKAVVLIVDALRHDFVCPSPKARHAVGGFPRTLQRATAAGDAAAVLGFVADTPTITMSRLKALITGGLPTFLDVGASFSASRVTEDNLITQLAATGKRMVFMGDDTWQQLLPHAFTESHPYPSFNVKDLHTVDDGVWEHLVPLLGRPGDWDVVIGHYLGVDHAGHTHGVVSSAMGDKLDQMDDQVAQVIDTLVAGGGPGGPYNNTLLLVFGDHGQTLGGDHGGGSREETDSTLLAFNIGRMAAATAAGAAVQQQGQEGLGQQQEQQGLGQQQQQQQEEVVPAGGIAQDRVAGGILQLMMQLAGPETDAPTTTHNKAPSGVSNAAAGNPPAADSAAAGSVEHQGHQQVGGGGSRPAPQLLCRHSIPQIDLTPTLALLLGVPIPFGNLGKAPPQLWAVLAQPTGAAGGVYGGNTVNSSSSWGNTEEGRTSSNARDDGSGGSGSDGWDGSSGVVGWLEAYSVALHRNVLQVHAYLQRYSHVAALPAAHLAAAEALYREALEAWGSVTQSSPGAAAGDKDASASSSVSGQPETNPSGQALARQGGQPQEVQGDLGIHHLLLALVQAQLRYLGAAAGLARAKFTSFQQGPMAAGCGAALALLAAQLWATWKCIQAQQGTSSSSSSSSRMSQATAAPSVSTPSGTHNIVHTSNNQPQQQQQQQPQQQQRQQQQQVVWGRLSLEAWAAAGLCLGHALALFSVGALMGEGRLQGLLLAVLTLLLLRSALRAAWCLRQQQRGSDTSCLPAEQPGQVGVKSPLPQGAATAAAAAAAAAGAKGAARVSGCSVHNPGVALAAAGVLLACNWGLQRLGLIDRYGQDPHDKTQPSFELLGGHPDAAGVQIQMLAVTLGPLAAGWVGLALADAWLRRLLQQQHQAPQLDGTAVHHTRGISAPLVLSCLTGCAQLTAAVQYVCLALFWSAQLTGWSNTTLEQLLEVCRMGGMPSWAPAAYTTLLQLPLRLLLPRVVYVGALLLIGVCGVSGLVLWAVGCISRCRSSSATTHARANPAAAVQGKGHHVLCSSRTQGSNSSSLGGGTSSPATLCSHHNRGGIDSQAQAAGTARLLVWVVAGLSGPVVMVLGYKGPALLALAGVQGAALLVLLGCCGVQQVAGAAAGGSAGGAARTPEAVGGAAHSSSRGSNGVRHHPRQATVAATATTISTSSSNGCSSSSSRGAASRDVMGAVAWSMAAVQLFFCSSHFCEFSGLQYTSSFIGFEDMEWYTSGSLLLVNTFGLTLLCWLSLPLVTLVPDLLVMNGVGSQHRRHHHHHQQQQQQGVKTANVSDRGHVHNNGHISSSGVSAAAPDLGTPRPTTTTNSISSVAEPNNSSSTSRSGRLPRLLCVLLVSSSLQWAKLSVCLVSAWVQQGHILLWAIFAPKLVFELWFMALADACYLAAAGLAALGAW